MKYTLLVAAFASLLFFSCDDTKNETPEKFDYNVTQFEDIKILRYQIPSWDKLTLKEQKLVYYLTQAGLEGRDIIWDQNYRHNLAIRKSFEQIYTTYQGDKRALTKDELRLTREKELLPPPPQELFYAFTRPLFNQTAGILQDRYRYLRK